jgi:hypothetical protein
MFWEEGGPQSRVNLQLLGPEKQSLRTNTATTATPFANGNCAKLLHRCCDAAHGPLACRLDSAADCTYRQTGTGMRKDMKRTDHMNSGPESHLVNMAGST